MTIRGNINTNGATAEGLITLLLTPCPSDTKQRLGVWYGPENAEASSAESSAEGSDTPDLTGTVGDKSRIQSFVDQFRFCGKSS